MPDITPTVKTVRKKINVQIAKMNTGLPVKTGLPAKHAQATFKYTSIIYNVNKKKNRKKDMLKNARQKA